MTSPTIDTLSYFLLVADAQTPPDVAAYAGRVVGIPTSLLASVGSGPDNPGRLVGLFGYRRAYTGPTVGGVTIAAEWYLAPAVPASIVNAFLIIPGAEGWLVPASRDAYANVGTTLITNPAPSGYAAATVLGSLGQLHAASRAELVRRFQLELPI